jgi:hypothetical protein
MLRVRAAIITIGLCLTAALGQNAVPVPQTIIASRIDVTVKPISGPFQLHGDKPAVVSIENVSQEVVRMIVRNGDIFGESLFRIEVSSPNGDRVARLKDLVPKDPVRERNRDLFGSAQALRIAPGKTNDWEVNLQDIFSFTAAGRYSMVVSMVDPRSRAVVKSPVVYFDVIQ